MRRTFLVAACAALVATPCPPLARPVRLTQGGRAETRRLVLMR